MSKPSARARKTAKRDKLRKAAKAGNQYKKSSVTEAQRMLDMELAKATNKEHGDGVAYVEKMLIDIITYLGRSSGTLNRLRAELLTGKIVTRGTASVDEMILAIDEEIQKMGIFKETKLRPMVNEMAKLKGMQDRAEQFLALAEFMETLTKFQESMNEDMGATAKVLETLDLIDNSEATPTEEKEELPSVPETVEVPTEEQVQ